MSSQVPLWITIVLAVLALFGPWGGGWIAARRDDKRWSRELQREDLRWQRERERVKEEVELKIKFHWRDERLRIYGEFLAQLDRIGYTIAAVEKSIMDNSGGEAYEIMAERADDLYGQIAEANATAFQISLVSGEDMTGVATQTIQGLQSTQFGYSISIAVKSPDGNPFNSKNALNWLRETVASLRLKMKDELGLRLSDSTSRTVESAT